ncbi:hypothetical protein F511_28940 [Dorcoceras hygrometricum]|uniref:Uncharacterized protein n=1 Tax=Dorcoceras hygrometricum TaxID=472368 RepID=A0A2Z7BXC7_9LAMI|nr:hypothetical protein F511_28940 [Dorcoceras hygrometricum]
MTSALLFERNQKSAEAQELVSAVMTSAYLLEEAGISNTDVSISVEKRRESQVTVEEAVRSVARKWKDDELAVTSVEEIWNLSNGHIQTEAIYAKATPLKKLDAGERVGVADVAKGDRVETWFDRALAEEIATAGSDSVDTMDFEVHSQNLPVVRDPNVDPAAEQEIPVLGEQLVDSVNEEEMQDENVQPAEAKIDKDEAMSLDDLIFLPKITADDKGKEALVEKDHVKGHPAREHYSSICANIDLLVTLREKIIEDVDQFLYSFSFKKLASINVEEMSKKEELVLSWGETESIHEALSRKRGPRDHGAVIARTNTNTPSRCWIRTMIYVDGVWTVEPCADRWVKIPTLVPSNDVPPQHKYDDTLPPTSKFFRLLTKRWAEICFEVVDFCASRRLLPVGSLQFCRSLSVVEPGYRVAPRQSSVFAFRVSQFCSVFVDFSVFSWLPTTDITDFLSSIALERTVLRNVQRSVSVVHPNVQFLDQHISSPTSSEESSMNFANTDIDATATAPAFSLPGSTTVSLDITKALNQLQASLDQISHRDDGAAFKDTILMHLRHIEKKFTARFDAQDRWIGALRNDLSDQRNLLSLEFKSSHRQLHTQIAAASIDQIDMKREMKELNAKVDAIATNLERVKRDAEATKEAIFHQLFEFQSQAQANHIILTTQLGKLVEDLNWGGNDKKGEGVSSRGPQSTRARVPVRVERRPLPTREPSPDAQSSGQYLSAE